MDWRKILRDSYHGLGNMLHPNACHQKMPLNSMKTPRCMI